VACYACADRWIWAVLFGGMGCESISCVVEFSALLFVVHVGRRGYRDWNNRTGNEVSEWTSSLHDL